MIERHTCYYRVNDTALYRQIIEAIGFDDAMKNIGVFKRTITELKGEEFKGVFEINPATHPNLGFEYFKKRGIFFSMTRPCEVVNLDALEPLDDLKVAVGM